MHTTEASRLEAARRRGRDGGRGPVLLRLHDLDEIGELGLRATKRGRRGALGDRRAAEGEHGAGCGAAGAWHRGTVREGAGGCGS